MTEAILVAAVAIFSSIASNAYFYGRLVERVKTLDTKADDFEMRLRKLEQS